MEIAMDIARADTECIDEADDEILSCALSDEALETAAGPERGWEFSWLFPPTAALCC
jgi:hypothetical protein